MERSQENGAMCSSEVHSITQRLGRKDSEVGVSSPEILLLPGMEENIRVRISNTISPPPM